MYIPRRRFYTGVPHTSRTLVEPDHDVCMYYAQQSELTMDRRCCFRRCWSCRDTENPPCNPLHTGISHASKSRFGGPFVHSRASRRRRLFSWRERPKVRRFSLSVVSLPVSVVHHTENSLSLHSAVSQSVSQSISMGKTRVGVLLRDTVGSNKSSNNSMDLEKLTQRYYEHAEHMSTLLASLREHHESLQRMEASRVKVSVRSFVQRRSMWLGCTEIAERF